MPRNAREAIEDSIAMSRQGARQVKLFHQQSHDVSYCHQLMELLGIFNDIENKIKTIGVEGESK